LQQGVPLGPAALAALVLQPADQREALAVDAAGRAQLQRAVVVEELGHLADALQHLAAAHHRAVAIAADGVRGLRRNSGAPQPGQGAR
jgi:hypothetical protein